MLLGNTYLSLSSYCSINYIFPGFITQALCFDLCNMSYHKGLLNILIFILLYCDHIIFWLAGSVSPLALEMGLEHDNGSQMLGEYG